MVQINPKAEIIIEDGWYPFSIEGVEEKETQFGEKLMLPFMVDAGADEGVVEITAFISYSDHPKSNVVKWGKALFGERPFDTDEFEGASGEAFVEEGEDKEGQPKNFIRKVRKGKKGKAKAKPSEAEVDESDFEEIPL